MTTPASSASDEALAAMIDAATSADFLGPLIAELPAGPLRERARTRARALQQTQAAHLKAEPQPSVERRYNLPDDAELALQVGHGLLVEFVAFSPNGARIVSGSEDRTIKLWDTASGRLLRTL